MSVEGIMDLDGTIALVTGGGSGLGEATARRLSAAGARVAVLDVSLEAARRVADDIGGEALAADVSNTTDVEAAFEQAIQAFRRCAARGCFLRRHRHGITYSAA
jgi:NAD(P)-dependent dehydrogenase (short-subunit alcohol dehydrogenase family)